MEFKFDLIHVAEYGFFSVVLVRPIYPDQYQLGLSKYPLALYESETI
jgi:hypothetical protein